MGSYSVRSIVGFGLVALQIISCSSDPKAELLPQSVNEKPTITLLGQTSIVLDVHSEFIEPGFLAQDKEDGVLTEHVTINSNLDTTEIGTYSLEYSVEDSAGASATATRIVQIVDREVPTIHLVGENPLLVDVQTAFVEPGFEVTDNYDQTLNSQVQIAGTVNTSVLGETLLTYNVSDSSHNAAPEVTRVIRVVDRTAPVITLMGDNPMNVEATTNFVDPGAQAMDQFEGDISSRILVLGSVDTRRLGDLRLTYQVSDNSGNRAVELTRVVRVVDTTPPVVSLSNRDIIYLDTGGAGDWMPPEAWAIDTLDGEIRAQIVSPGIPIDNPGSYRIDYQAVDRSGNRSEIASIPVVVRDRTAPSLELRGDSEIHLEAGTIFTDPGAIATDLVDGDLTSRIQRTNFPGTYYQGIYEIEYSVSDRAGNLARAVRTIHVDPIQICHIPDLDKLRNAYGADAYLNCDIDLAAIENFSPIPFIAGTFYGNGHRILNLKIDEERLHSTAAFVLGLSGRVENLHMVNVSVRSANAGAGGMFGALNPGSVVENCSVEGSVTGRGEVGLLAAVGGGGVEVRKVVTRGSANRISDLWFYDGGVGGIVGTLSQGKIMNSISHVSVTGNAGSLGGIVGYLGWGGEIIDSSATGRISISENSISPAPPVGGLVGTGGTVAKVIRSQFSGTVSGDSMVGGILGYAETHTWNPEDEIEIRDVLFTGELSARMGGGIVGANGAQLRIDRALSLGQINCPTISCGGIVGYPYIFGYGFNISQAFWNSDRISIQNEYGEGRTESELLNPNTYDATWDFENVWILEDGALPQLR